MHQYADFGGEHFCDENWKVFCSMDSQIVITLIDDPQSL